MWSDQEVDYYIVLSETHEHLYLLKLKEGCWMRTTLSYGNDTALMSSCIKLIKSQCVDKEWLKQKQNSSLGKLLFKNGYLDLRKNEFYTEFDPETVFFREN